ncbi:DUF5690 family protein [Asticcacaulis sp. AC402]|uniref:DUF5690 family protein n=1 Tax=Asticcacaulis sp. AC402 TaxID=1282361 RepID=UPI0003C3D648|nr:DUF5690 family protein [Asticcacaulis sp. AC402]ESQ73809.1 membrane protein [Asticcacaulis sp. AC402]
MPRTSPLTRWLSQAPPAIFTLYGGLMAFGAYFAMYAFRKPFTAASFTEVAGFVVDYKIALVIAQVFGYALSKVIGIRFVSELPGRWRAAAILVLIAIAELALVGFATVPAPYNIAMLFLNGLPLGMIWGLVFGFLEGRRTSEVLGAILCASFIVASGVVKSVGVWLMAQNFATEFTMPAVTGAVFAPLLVLCVYGLTQLPPPTAADIAARVERAPMDKAARQRLFAAYAPGLLALIALYVMLTALRDLRDNFAAEIWQGVGLGGQPALFSLTEIPIAFVVLAAMAALAVVRDNRTAIMANLGLIGLGLVVTATSSLAFHFGAIGPVLWMILLGAGLYLAYTPYNGLMFDRLVAATGRVGTAGFLIYVADSSGYLGSVALLLVKNFSGLDLPWVGFMTAAAVVSGVVGLFLLAYAGRYFFRRFS